MNIVLQVLPWVGYVILAVCVVMLVRWILSLRRVVKPSEVHIVRRAKKTEVYGDTERIQGTENKLSVAGNSYYAVPSWVPVYGVEIRTLPSVNFPVNLENYEAYDQDKVPFMVDVTAFFRIEDFQRAAARIVDDRSLREHLAKVVQGAVRSILAKDKLESIMVNRATYGKQFTTAVAENLKEWGVAPVQTIELMDVRDKTGEKVIENIMQKRKSYIDMESRKEVAKNKQEAREAEIASEQQIALKEQEKTETVGKRTAQQEKEVGIAHEKAQQEIQSQAKVTKTCEMEVKQVEIVRQAEIDKEKVIVDANAKKEAGQIDAQTKVLVAEQGKIAAGHDAEALLIKTTKEAEGQLIVAQNQAKGIEAKGLADALAKEKFGQAEVAPQITLAKEIGENQGYQSYLIEIKKVEANQTVGVEQAKNLGNAQIKIVANAGGNVQEGVSSVMDLFTAKGGQSLGSMLEAFAGTEQGQQLLSKLFGKNTEPKTDKGGEK